MDQKASTTEANQVSLAPNDLGVLSRKWPVALAFSIFLGWAGIDRFYLGNIGTGVLKLLTLGGLGLWWLIDILVVATKSVKGISWKARDPRKSWLADYYPAVIAAFLGIYVYSIWLIRIL